MTGVVYFIQGRSHTPIKIGYSRGYNLRLEASIRSLVTVLREAPVIRVIARMDDPSQSICRMVARLATGSLFMRGIIPAHAHSLKHKVYFELWSARGGEFGLVPASLRGASYASSRRSRSA